MRIATIASLGASALLGVGALVVAKVWLPASQGPSRAAAAEASARMTSVVAAAGAVPFGQKLEAKNLTLVRLPVEAVPEGAYTSIAQVIALDGGAPVALTALVAREPILPSKISGAGAKPSVAATIAPGMRAYTIRVSDVAGGGGHVLPGDRVDVLLAREVGDGSVEGGGGAKAYVSDVVIQNVRVLGMDLIADPTSTEKFPPKTATLEVDVEAAGKLAIAGEIGVLSLALRRTGAAEVAAVHPVGLRDITSGSRPYAAAPIRRAAARSGSAPRTAPRGLVLTQGGERTVVNVPTERSGS